MARFADLKLAYRIFMQAYPYRQIDWRLGTQLHKPLKNARLAVVTNSRSMSASTIRMCIDRPRSRMVLICIDSCWTVTSASTPAPSLG